MKDNNGKIVAEAEKSFNFSKSETMGSGYVLQIIPSAPAFCSLIHGTDNPLIVKLGVLDKNGSEVSDATDFTLAWEDIDNKDAKPADFDKEDSKTYKITSLSGRKHSVLVATAKVGSITLKEKYSLAFTKGNTHWHF